jgi:hypothetical protein
LERERPDDKKRQNPNTTQNPHLIEQIIATHNENLYMPLNSSGAQFHRSFSEEKSHLLRPRLNEIDPDVILNPDNSVSHA